MTNDRQLLILREALTAPFQRESEVVYFVTELRKLIEGIENRYPVLNFFCDWVLHRQLERKTAKEILREFDALVEKRITLGAIPQELVDRIKPLISLLRFRTDLFLILSEHGLDKGLVSDLAKWFRFLSLYVDIISRTPLIADPAKLGLTHLDNIVLSKSGRSLGAPAGPCEFFVFGLKWDLRKQDTELVSLFNEIWIPAEPVHTAVKVAQLTNEDGVLKRVPLEATSLWD